MVKKQLSNEPTFEESFVTSFRVQYGLWKAFKLKCLVEGLQPGVVLNNFLTSYVGEDYIKTARTGHIATEKHQ